MNRAFIFIGTNIDREHNYIEALRQLAQLGQVRGTSRVYETAPVGGYGDDFYNGAVLLETSLSAGALKQALHDIERRMGRERTQDRNSPRTIDLDLVLYNHDHIDDGQVRVPDPLILQRPFLAQALAELDPDYVHPTDGITLGEIAARLKSDADGMRLEPAMTARVEQFLQEIQTGVVAHA